MGRQCTSGPSASRGVEAGRRRPTTKGAGLTAGPYSWPLATPEEIWAILRETAREQQENAREMREWQQETARLQRENERRQQEIARLQRENDRRLYGAMPHLEADDSVAKHAARKGLFVIRATGSSASIVDRPDFRPRIFSGPPPA